MALMLPELDESTRHYMVGEFEREQQGHRYVPAVLSSYGRRVWPLMLRNALSVGSDVSLIADLLAVRGVFVQREPWVRGGVLRERDVNPVQAAERLGTGEFNTWYVRGLSARLIDEGVADVVVFRAASAKWAPAGCERHEGSVVSVREVYNGHRAKYWPVEDPSAFSVPYQPGCHHSIARAA